MPKRHKRGNTMSCKIFEEEQRNFNDLGSMPMNRNIQRLNSCRGIAEIFHSAVWHASCFGKVKKKEVERASR